MFYKNTLTGKKSKESTFQFDMFGENQNKSQDETTLEVGESQLCYNFISQDGTLKSGYGFKNLSMPTSEDDLYTETEISIRGREVKTMWKLKWYNQQEDINCYFLFYFNDEGNICYDNLFKTRLDTFVLPTTFTQTPYATYYRKSGNDAILLSGEGQNLMVLTGSNIYTSENAPKIISCCNHYGKLFAITASARGTLVYNEDPDVLAWSDEKTKDLDFSDERGDLNKIISFNDYIYLFRDFGITQVSEYGNDGQFSVSHLYKSNAYIHPKTIAQEGDNIYFLEGEKLKVFNGSSVKELKLGCLDIIKNIINQNAVAECFEGKYYLACRANFNDGRDVGCENFEGGYVNNALIVVDCQTQHVDILRGMDIKELLALTNPLKSKLVACFNMTSRNTIGELTTDGALLGFGNPAKWISGKTDFGHSGKLKRVKSFLINSASDCTVTLQSDKTTKTFAVKGSDKVQKIRANVLGNQFTVKIEAEASDDVYISNFVLTVSVG